MSKKEMKRILALTGAMVIGAGALTALAGCGSSDSEESAPASSEASSAASSADTEKDITGRVFKYGVTAYSGSGVGVDPHDAYCGWSTLRYGIGETLAKISDEGTMEPWVADSWKANDDSTEWTFEINDNVTFSNGKKVDAEAVKACFERLLEKNERAASGTLIKSMKADGQTLTITTSEPNPILVNWLADPFACIIDVSGKVDGLKDVVGTGPYTLDHADDENVVVNANTNYWNGSPKFETVEVKCFLDGDTLSMAMQNGELDACANLGYDTVGMFNGNSDFVINSAATSRSYMYTFNTKDENLSNANVRKAIDMAIDKDAFVNSLMSGYGSKAELLYPASYAFGDSKITGPEYNQDEAKKILEEEGYKDSDGDGYVEKDGKMFEINYVTYKNRQELPLLAEYVQAQLKDIGIKVSIDDAEGNTVIGDVPKDFDMYSWAIVTAPYADGITFCNEFLNNYSIHDWSGEERDAFEALYEKARVENDAEKRAEYSVELQQMLVDNDVLWVASHNQMNIVVKSSVTGLAPHPSDYYEITADVDRAD